MNVENLHQVLQQLYAGMMPMCGDMAGVAKGIAGLGALFYVAYRVWQSLSQAEPIDVFPLLRPLAIGICIMFFPTLVIGTINSVMSPIVKGTHTMLQSQTFDMNSLAQQRDRLEYEIKKRNPEYAYMVDDEAFEARMDQLGMTQVGKKLGLYADRIAYKFKKWLQEAIRNILEVIFQAAALVIDVVRTFILIVLSILGPIAFALSVWDGFQSSLTGWISRYISVYLWLPVADLFSCVLARIQTLMIEKDIEQMKIDPGFSVDSADAVYILFMLIGIIGYFTIPTVAGWIIQTAGGGAMARTISNMAIKTGAAGAAFAGAAAGNGAAMAMKGAGFVGGKLMKGAKSLINGIRGKKGSGDNASNS